MKWEYETHKETICIKAFKVTSVWTTLLTALQGRRPGRTLMFIWHNSLSLHSATYLISFPINSFERSAAYHSAGAGNVAMFQHQTEKAQETLEFFWMSANSRTDLKGKDEVHPNKGDEGPEVEQVYSSTLSLTSALDEAGW